MSGTGRETVEWDSIWMGDKRHSVQDSKRLAQATRNNTVEFFTLLPLIFYSHHKLQCCLFLPYNYINCVIHSNEVQSMLERFGGKCPINFSYFPPLNYLFDSVNYVIFPADISKAMQAKRKRLETFTKSSLKGSNQKLEQLWRTQHAQRY